MLPKTSLCKENGERRRNVMASPFLLPITVTPEPPTSRVQLVRKSGTCNQQKSSILQRNAKLDREIVWNELRIKRSGTNANKT
jgi:hypothetical protein